MGYGRGRSAPHPASPCCHPRVRLVMVVFFRIAGILSEVVFLLFWVLVMLFRHNSSRLCMLWIIGREWLVLSLGRIYVLCGGISCCGFYYRVPGNFRLGGLIVWSLSIIFISKSLVSIKKEIRWHISFLRRQLQQMWIFGSHFFPISGFLLIVGIF